MVAGGQIQVLMYEKHITDETSPLLRALILVRSPTLSLPKKTSFCLDLFLLRIDIPHCTDVDMFTVL